jgi:glycerophosphoryl diester phosphodiesterase
MPRGRERIGSTGSVMTVAHRGEPMGFRENTLPSVLAALRAGADMVEIDVKTTADGDVVLLHDDTLERLWERPWVIRQTTRAQLAELGAPAAGVPLLHEALAAISRTDAALMIDMDAPDLAEPALGAVRASLDAGWLEPDEVVWCGNLPALKTIRRQDPEARIVLSWGERHLPGDSDVAEVRPEAFNPTHLLVTEGTVDWAAERGLALCCWTVDDAVRMRELCDLGVDAIISNRIGLLTQTVRR